MLQYSEKLLQYELVWAVLVQDIPLCLKYNINMTQNTYSVLRNYPYILLFQMWTRMLRYSEKLLQYELVWAVLVQDIPLCLKYNINMT